MSKGQNPPGIRNIIKNLQLFLVPIINIMSKSHTSPLRIFPVILLKTLGFVNLSHDHREEIEFDPFHV